MHVTCKLESMVYGSFRASYLALAQACGASSARWALGEGGAVGRALAVVVAAAFAGEALPSAVVADR